TTQPTLTLRLRLPVPLAYRIASFRRPPTRSLSPRQSKSHAGTRKGGQMVLSRKSGGSSWLPTRGACRKSRVCVQTSLPRERRRKGYARGSRTPQVERGHHHGLVAVWKARLPHR
ncbi:unnamed protein product, partial [Ectocarpus sp. 8 AP-2014]